jgi:hypothetical protein
VGSGRLKVPAVVVALFVPGENGTDEAGQLVYHRFVDDTDG